MQLRTHNLTWQVIADEAVVLDLSGSVYLRLNGSGRLLWEHLAHGATESDLVDALVGEYDVDIESARADVARFLADLHSRDLIDGD